jgi:nucleotide-binding universal stress UspA family protein
MLTSEENLILVPYDFTAPSDCALQHAIGIAKAASDRIMILHVLNSESKSMMKKEKLSIKDLNDKLQILANDITAKSGVTATYEMEEGSIFTTIPEYVESSKARLLVLGTSGKVGMQHITGAHVLKIAESSTAPDIIVQTRPMRPHGYKTIVMPVDSTKESKQKTAQTAALAQIFGGEVHLFVATESDEFLANSVAANVAYAEKMFKNHNIKYKISKENPKGKSYVKQILAYAESVDADLLVIMTGEDRGLLDIITGGSDEENIVNNKAQIPVLCIDPMNAQYGSVFTW